MGGTDLINMSDNNQRNYKIAVNLYEINKDKKYKPDYKNIVEFSKDILGYKQAMTYKMVVVGQKFIYRDSDGQIKNIFDSPYNISQLIQMTGFKVDDLMLLHVRNLISPDLTVKELNKVLQNKLK